MPWRIVAIWGCFLARLGFYATVLPLWEGYDEWAHFSVIRSVAIEGRLLPPRDQPLAGDVERSLQLAPVAWELRSLPFPSLTQDAFWRLPLEERAQREREFRAIGAAEIRGRTGGALTAYEALQPPLYYWSLAPVVRLLSGAGLATQVMAVRWCSVLIASFVIPLVFFTAREIFPDVRLALLCAAGIALMPELAIDLARVGNDALAVPLYTLLTWLGLILYKRPSGRAALQLGIVFGLGLLTKAYFLTAMLPLLLLAYKARRIILTCFLVAALISGWWYVRNLLVTGTISGLSESVQLRGVGLLSLLGRGLEINWRTAVDGILFSQIYFGGWSSLTVRSWMYHVFYGLVAIATIGLWRAVRLPAMWWIVAVYAAFWAGQLYNVILLYASKGLQTSMGWYLYAVIAAEAILCVAGLSQIHRWAATAGIVLFALLDLYTVHAVAIPYYTGMIRHGSSGALAAFHVADMASLGIRGVIERLTIFKGPLVSELFLALLWLTYLIATLALVFTAIANTPDSAGSPRKPAFYP